METFQKFETKTFGIGGKESEVIGKISLAQPVFVAFADLVRSLTTNLNQLELLDLKGREASESLLPTVLANGEKTGEHELFFLKGKRRDSENKSEVTFRRAVTTPFLRFEGSSIVQSYQFIGCNSLHEAIDLQGIAVEEMRFGLEFFGASVFSKFFNFAPSVVATIQLEVSHSEFGLRIWKEIGRKIYQEKIFNEAVSDLRSFCAKELQRELPPT